MGEDWFQKKAEHEGCIREVRKRQHLGPREDLFSQGLRAYESRFTCRLDKRLKREDTVLLVESRSGFHVSSKNEEVGQLTGEDARELAELFGEEKRPKVCAATLCEDPDELGYAELRLVPISPHDKEGLEK